MRISDWSSDVCSSDLQPLQQILHLAVLVELPQRPALHQPLDHIGLHFFELEDPPRIVEQPGEPHPDRRRVRMLGQPEGGPDVHLPRRQLDRSEEHTSELQSLMRISYAVFCLEKKTT